jgi:hypothetical protein
VCYLLSGWDTGGVVRGEEGMPALMPSILNKAFKGEL